MLACGIKLFHPLFRVSDIRFSKCSVQGACHRTQPAAIRHPCLSAAFRRRRAAELLVNEQNIKKSLTSETSHKCRNHFAQHADFSCWRTEKGDWLYGDFGEEYECDLVSEVD